MIFYINKIVLWLRTGEKRYLEFEKNKVNIITGNSKTGKTAILEIIDYCLCSTRHNISEEYIGENVTWYGLDFCINNKHYFISRGDTKNNSSKFYFSATGIEPETPNDTISMGDVKNILEEEFSIDKNTVIPFGGKTIKQGSKISYRYFLMFNTISGDIIENSKTYFDKQYDDRYREALPRIFDIATGITTIKDILLRGQVDKLKIELNKLCKERDYTINVLENRNLEIKKIIKKAIDAKLITESIDNEQACINQLKNIIETLNLDTVLLEDYSEKLEKLKIEKQNLEIKKLKLKKFQNRYNKYKKSLEEQHEALKPIEYIKTKFGQNIEAEEYLAFLNLLENDYKAIKESIQKKMPFENGVKNKIEEIEKAIEEIDLKIDLAPNTSYIALDDKTRLVLLGEIKNNFIDLINNDVSTKEIEEKIKLTEDNIDKLETEFTDYEENKKNLINSLNDYIQTYIKFSKDALDEYGSYLSDYDYKNKMLKLRKEKSLSTANISSSSDHMYLHLCLFLGLHELLSYNQSQYIPSFLIIDQPTRPYFVNEKKEKLKNVDYQQIKEQLSKKGDWCKVINIFYLLDGFMQNIKKNNKEFQIIVLEHVSKDAWSGLENIHLVAEFDGEINALIPPNLENGDSKKNDTSE